MKLLQFGSRGLTQGMASRHLVGLSAVKRKKVFT
jgi:hypothetical protein